MGAQRWIDLGFMRLQPSELTKITLVMVLAAYYDWLPTNKNIPPDLGDYPCNYYPCANGACARST